MRPTIRRRVPFSRILASCLFSLLVCGPARALDPSRLVSQYGHSAWRIQDGVFSGAPHAITQTADGYLWIGTESGLLRFDGVRFVPWTPPEGKALPNSAIYSLLGTGDGSLWIGTGRGLARWKDGRLVNYQGVVGRINSIIEDRKGALWIARSRSGDATGPLCQVMGTNLRCYGKADGIQVLYGEPLVEDSLGNLWIGGSKGLCRWKPGSSSIYLEKELKQADGLSGVAGLAAAEDGSLWVGITRPGKALGLRQFAKEVSKSYIVPGIDGSSLAVNTLFLDRSNTLWVGTPSQGLFRVHDGRAAHFRSADGLSSDSIEHFYQDREGNLWVVTSKGIDCFRDLRVASFSVREGLSADVVDSVLAAHDGTVWIGNHGGLDLIRQGTLSNITPRDGMPGERVTSLFEDDAGRLWVGVDGGLAVYDHKRFQSIRRPDGSSVGPVVAMTEDTDHNIWAETIGSQPSMVRIRDQQVRDVFPASQIPRASRLAADPQGGIWLGLRSGALARYHNGNFETISVSQKQEVQPIRDLRVDSDGAIWAATNLGLFRWKDGKGNILSSRNGLPCDSINAFVRDNSGSLWLSTECGFVVIADSEIEKWRKQPGSTVKASTLDAYDGAQPAAAPFSPPASKSVDGRLWFANESIVQMIDPSHLAGNTIPPPVHIEQIVADGKNYSPRENVRLPPHTRDLEIDFTALSFVVPQKVHFRYKLEGRDADWQDAQTRRQAFYNDLPPANYKFRVIACNNDGVWNEDGAFLDFSVVPAYYQTTWFRSLCVIAFLALIAALYRLRLRQVARQFNMRLEERVGERIRVARDLHDTLLQSFQGLLMKYEAATDLLPDNATEARKLFESTTEQARKAIIEGRDAVYGLRSSTIVTNELARAISAVGEELAAIQSDGNRSEFRVLVEGASKDIVPLIRDEIYRIGCEAVRNAFKHAHARGIELELCYDQRKFRLRVSDDGRGIDPKILAEGGSPRHYGMPGMQERARLVRGKLTVLSKPGSGTEIELTIPASVAYMKSPEPASQYHLR
ncbi:MAG TPA: two-component regulator propeller domain-containing protein [Terriglobales bacterium]|jgi:ligand-binding sensor domain-containing protein/signal transduction histidine kinase|nr:two-component regulator propeller domain-containing protein [Terriglobales bacterium]